jgi:hypothetical protein
MQVPGVFPCALSTSAEQNSHPAVYQASFVIHPNSRSTGGMYPRFYKLFFNHSYTITQPLNGTFSSIATELSKSQSTIPRSSPAFRRSSVLNPSAFHFPTSAFLNSFVYNLKSLSSVRAQPPPSTILKYTNRRWHFQAPPARIRKVFLAHILLSLAPATTRGFAAGHSGTEEPVPLPKDWARLVNEPQTEAEVAAIRASIERGRPFGNSAWTRLASAKLGLESSLRPRGRPKKGETK